MSGQDDWLDRHTSRAPAALRARVREHASPVAADASLPLGLAAAARRTVEAVAAHRGDRSVALDLLAADALITLALLAQAQRDPARLGAFAAAALRAGRPGA